MGLFSHFFRRKKMSFVSQLIDKIGFEDASIFCYGLITAKLANTNTHIMLAQMSQFIREEFDAASQGNSYSRTFVQKQCPDSSWYRGAMQETPKYPIDEAGGPQQTLLVLANPMVSENPDLAVKFRCHLVEMIYEDYQLLSSELSNIPISAVAAADFVRRRERVSYLCEQGDIQKILS